MMLAQSVPLCLNSLESGTLVCLGHLCISGQIEETRLNLAFLWSPASVLLRDLSSQASFTMELLAIRLFTRTEQVDSVTIHVTKWLSYFIIIPASSILLKNTAWTKKLPSTQLVMFPQSLLSSRNNYKAVITVFADHVCFSVFLFHGITNNRGYIWKRSGKHRKCQAISNGNHSILQDCSEH